MDKTAQAQTKTSNSITPFVLENLAVRGKLLRLSGLATHIPSLQNTTASMASAMAELVACAALLLHDFKQAESLTLQIQNATNGGLMAANINKAGTLKAYTNKPMCEADEIITPEAILAVTAHTKDTPPYQSMVALESTSITAALENYFAQSMQSTTQLYIQSDYTQTDFACAALFLQALPGEKHPPSDDDWHRFTLLTQTLTPQEFLPGDITPNGLLFRLFHEDGVSVFAPTPLNYNTAPSRPKMEAALISLGEGECEALLMHGPIEMTDQYTGAHETFTADDIRALFAADGSTESE